MLSARFKAHSSSAEESQLAARTPKFKLWAIYLFLPLVTKFPNRVPSFILRSIDRTWHSSDGPRLSDCFQRARRLP
jgi:hypothetical protein